MALSIYKKIQNFRDMLEKDIPPEEQAAHLVLRNVSGSQIPQTIAQAIPATQLKKVINRELQVFQKTWPWPEGVPKPIRETRKKRPPQTFTLSELQEMPKKRPKIERTEEELENMSGGGGKQKPTKQTKKVPQRTLETISEEILVQNRKAKTSKRGHNQKDHQQKQKNKRRRTQ